MHMSISKKIVAYLFLFVMPFALFVQISDKVKIVGSGDKVSIENKMVKVEFNLSTGRYNAVNNKDNSVCLSDGYFLVGQSASDNPEFARSWKQEEVADDLGIGKKLIIKAKSDGYCAIIKGIC